MFQRSLDPVIAPDKAPHTFAHQDDINGPTDPYSELGKPEDKCSLLPIIRRGTAVPGLMNYKQGDRRESRKGCRHHGTAVPYQRKRRALAHPDVVMVLVLRSRIHRTCHAIE